MLRFPPLTCVVAVVALCLASSAMARGSGGRGGGGGGGHNGGHSAGGHSGWGHGGGYRGTAYTHFGGYWGSGRAPAYVGFSSIYPYYYPAAYPPVGVVVQPMPLSLGTVEDEPALFNGQPSTAYWYYCPASQAYFPYVQVCSELWQQIMPQPPAPPPPASVAMPGSAAPPSSALPAEPEVQ